MASLSTDRPFFKAPNMKGNNLSNSTISRNVGVIGLGSMGGAMAGTFVRQGWNVLGFDPSPEAQQRAGQQGVSTTSDLSDLAGHDYLVLSVPSAEIVEQAVPVLLSRTGTQAIVDTSTSEPETSAAMAELAESREAQFIDSPVSGGSSGAAAGTLSAFVGGSDAALTAARPILDVLTGGNYRHIGKAGSGNVVKLLNNMLCSVNLAAVAEAMDVVAAFGIDVDNAIGALNSATGSSHVSKRMFPDWILSGTFDSGFSMGLMARDVALALRVSQEAGTKPTIMATTNELWQGALAELGPKADFTSSTTVFTSSGEGWKSGSGRNAS